MKKFLCYDPVSICIVKAIRAHPLKGISSTMQYTRYFKITVTIKSIVGRFNCDAKFTEFHDILLSPGLRTGNVV